jgi:hypothetical protein
MTKIPKISNRWYEKFILTSKKLPYYKYIVVILENTYFTTIDKITL